jgi:hypothetical protein
MEYAILWAVSIVILSILYYKHEIKPECEENGTYTLTSEDLFVIIGCCMLAPIVVFIIIITVLDDIKIPNKKLFVFKCKKKKTEES